MSTPPPPDVKLPVKDNLIERMGGEAQLEMTILGFCDRLQADNTLKKYYGKMEPSNLMILQRDAIDYAFAEDADDASDAQAQAYEKLESKVLLQHYRLLDAGLGAKHFPAIRQHFVESLRESWAEESVIQDAEKHFDTLKFIFGSLAEWDGGQEKKQNDAIRSSIQRHSGQRNSGQRNSFQTIDEGKASTSTSTSPMVSPRPSPAQKANKNVRRRSSAKERLAAVFQSLGKKSKTTEDDEEM
eukprot:Nitzschia sp. Nitz4//scaffold190_size42200//10912//11637//NITZ4_007389-RA/size42200-processed-gene-0.59-mRNA-1//1//CDS//3329540135//8657//frame0